MVEPQVIENAGGGGFISRETQSSSEDRMRTERYIALPV